MSLLRCDHAERTLNTSAFTEPHMNGVLAYRKGGALLVEEQRAIGLASIGNPESGHSYLRAAEFVGRNDEFYQ
jgi:hypothetical protein